MTADATIDTIRLVDLGVAYEGVRRVVLADVRECAGSYISWRMIEGYDGCAIIRGGGTNEAEGVASIKAQLEAMLAATALPVLHLDDQWRLVERTPADHQPEPAR